MRDSAVWRQWASEAVSPTFIQTSQPAQKRGCSHVEANDKAYTSEHRPAGELPITPCRRAVPSSELPNAFRPGDQTAIDACPGTTARMPPPTPLLPGSRPNRQSRLNHHSAREQHQGVDAACLSWVQQVGCGVEAGQEPAGAGQLLAVHRDRALATVKSAADVRIPCADCRTSVESTPGRSCGRPSGIPEGGNLFINRDPVISSRRANEIHQCVESAARVRRIEHGVGGDQCAALAKDCAVCRLPAQAR